MDKPEDLIVELKGKGVLIKEDGYSPLFFNDADVQEELKQTCNMKYLCADLDEDCDKVTDKMFCYQYDPAQGICPFVHGLN